jgi:hypothetical protein
MWKDRINAKPMDRIHQSEFWHWSDAEDAVKDIQGHAPRMLQTEAQKANGCQKAQKESSWQYANDDRIGCCNRERMGRWVETCTIYGIFEHDRIENTRLNIPSGGPTESTRRYKGNSRPI